MNFAAASFAFAVALALDLPPGERPSTPPAGPVFSEFVGAAAGVAKLADGREVRVEKNGGVTFAGAAYKAFKAECRGMSGVSFAVVERASDVTVFIDTAVEQERNGVKAPERDDMIAVAFDVSGKRLWSQRISNRSGDPTRDLFFTDNLIILRERDGVHAIDRKDGRIAWVFDNDPASGVLNELMLEHAEFKDGILSVKGRYQLRTAEGRSRAAIDLDVATGERVYRRQSHVAPAANPIYVRPPFRLEYPSDRAPPEVPTDWDGVRLGYTSLVWNRTSGTGLIVNPLKNDLKAITAAAGVPRFKGKDGKLVPIRWLYVVDGAAVSGSSSALVGGTATRVAAGLEKPVAVKDVKPMLAPDGDERFRRRPPLTTIEIEKGDDLNNSGELVVADLLAKTLGATAVLTVTTPLATPSGPVLFFRDDNVMWNATPEQLKEKLFIQWGPYVFKDGYSPLWRPEPW